MIEFSWTPDTAFNPANWTPARPMTGHCAVAALIVNDVYGGEILRCVTNDGSHYFNRLPDGSIYDATAGQFDSALDYSRAEPRSRGYLLSNHDTATRYVILKSRSSVNGESIAAIHQETRQP